MPYPGAVETVNAWHAAGHFIHITSHRSTDSHDATVAWLEAIGLQHDELYCSYDKITRCREIGIDVLVDDSPVNLERALDEGIIGGDDRAPLEPGARRLAGRHRRGRLARPGSGAGAGARPARLTFGQRACNPRTPRPDRCVYSGRSTVPRSGSLRVRRAHVIAIAVVAALAVVVVGGAWAYDRGRQDTIVPGVKIGGVDVGGLTATQAQARLERRLLDPLREPIVITKGHALLAARVDRGAHRGERAGQRRRGDGRRPRRQLPGDARGAR